MQQTASYFRNSNLGGASPVESEILAFGLCNDRLAKAADGRTRIDALARNHELWSILVRDLSGDGNKLPEALRNQLISIGFWSMTYSNMAISKDLSLQPLIDVNRNISDGLRMQRRAQAVMPDSTKLSVRSA
jgi:flagellar biosynthesis regulator FlaF